MGHGDVDPLVKHEWGTDVGLSMLLFLHSIWPGVLEPWVRALVTAEICLATPIRFRRFDAELDYSNRLLPY